MKTRRNRNFTKWMFGVFFMRFLSRQKDFFRLIVHVKIFSSLRVAVILAFYLFSMVKSHWQREDVLRAISNKVGKLVKATFQIRTYIVGIKLSFLLKDVFSFSFRKAHRLKLGLLKRLQNFKKSTIFIMNQYTITRDNCRKILPDK